MLGLKSWAAWLVRPGVQAWPGIMSDNPYMCQILPRALDGHMLWEALAWSLGSSQVCHSINSVHGLLLPPGEEGDGV